jgi:hypothetical protein
VSLLNNMPNNDLNMVYALHDLAVVAPERYAEVLNGPAEQLITDARIYAGAHYRLQRNLQVAQSDIINLEDKVARLLSDPLLRPFSTKLWRDVPTRPAPFTPAHANGYLNALRRLNDRFRKMRTYQAEKIKKARIKEEGRVLTGSAYQVNNPDPTARKRFADPDQELVLPPSKLSRPSNYEDVEAQEASDNEEEQDEGISTSSSDEAGDADLQG